MTLGEFYTPRWLAAMILEESGYDGAAGVRLLDPSCGPGVFLTLAIERARGRGATARDILEAIHGYELNPESARAARLAYLEAMGGLAAGLAASDVPVFCRDALLDPAAGPAFDFVVGNPPWVRWDHLPAAYREATLPLWKRYGLFSLSGFAARSGGGKKDLSMLFTYAAADRYLKPGGRLAFVITQEVFKSKGAGEGFRRFRLGAQGEPLQVQAVHDFTALRPFPGASNKTAAVILTKGRPTSYAVPYFVWTRNQAGRLQSERLAAEPLGGPHGPWQTLAAGASGLKSLAGANPYKAVLGANANPYGVFWVEVKSAAEGGLAVVRNLPEFGKTALPAVEAAIEAELLFPALRGADVHRWSVRPRVHVLMVQDPATRAGFPESVLAERWPAAGAYLGRFRGALLERALYRKYHQDARRPYYSQFNVGPEMAAPFKVVWRRMARDLTAAVVSEWEGPLGRKRIVPLETTAFIGVRAEDEAHYLCALLNSGPVQAFVKSFSAAGRGFGTPSAIGQIAMPRFDPSDARHRALAEASRQLHAGACAAAEASLDRAARLLWGL